MMRRKDFFHTVGANGGAQRRVSVLPNAHMGAERIEPAAAPGAAVRWQWLFSAGPVQSHCPGG